MVSRRFAIEQFSKQVQIGCSGDSTMRPQDMSTEKLGTTLS